jgi:hypothetical protein
MMFPLDSIEHLRKISYERDLYEEEGPNEVFHVEYLDGPFDEDIWASFPHPRQEENMMSCIPFEDLDDTLFHDFVNEEVLEDPLDATNYFEKRRTKRSVLRIKPLVLKRRWRGMPIKRKKNPEEAQHVETYLSLLLLDEGEVFEPCSPPAHKVEETRGLNDPVEAAPSFAHPGHEEKEMVFFSYTDGLMKEPLDMVDDHIDTFIQTGRRI